MSTDSAESSDNGAVDITAGAIPHGHYDPKNDVILKLECMKAWEVRVSCAFPLHPVANAFAAAVHSAGFHPCRLIAPGQVHALCCKGATMCWWVSQGNNLNPQWGTPNRLCQQSLSWSHSLLKAIFSCS